MIYEAIKRVVDRLDKVGEVVREERHFLFRGVMMPPGAYKVAIRFDPAQGHDFLRLDRKPGQ